MQHVNSASVYDEREFKAHNISVWVAKRAVTYEYLPYALGAGQHALYFFIR